MTAVDLYEEGRPALLFDVLLESGIDVDVAEARRGGVSAHPGPRHDGAPAAQGGDRPIQAAVFHAIGEPDGAHMECAEKLAYAGADLSGLSTHGYAPVRGVFGAARRRSHSLLAILSQSLESTGDIHAISIQDGAPREALSLRSKIERLIAARAAARGARALCGQEVGRQRAASAPGNAARAAWAASGDVGPPPEWPAFGPQWLILRAVAHRASAEAAEAEAGAVVSSAIVGLGDALRRHVDMFDTAICSMQQAEGLMIL